MRNPGLCEPRRNRRKLRVIRKLVAAIAEPADRHDMGCERRVRRPGDRQAEFRQPLPQAIRKREDVRLDGGRSDLEDEVKRGIRGVASGIIDRADLEFPGVGVNGKIEGRHFRIFFGRQRDRRSRQIDRHKFFRPRVAAIQESGAVKSEQALGGRDDQTVEPVALDIGLQDTDGLNRIDEKEDVAVAARAADLGQLGAQAGSKGHRRAGHHAGARIDRGDHPFGIDGAVQCGNRLHVHAQPAQMKPGNDIVRMFEFRAENDIVALAPVESRRDRVDAFRDVLDERDLRRSWRRSIGRISCAPIRRRFRARRVPRANT